MFPKIAKSIFGIFELCLVSNPETKKFLENESKVGRTSGRKSRSWTKSSYALDSKEEVNR